MVLKAMQGWCTAHEFVCSVCFPTVYRLNLSPKFCILTLSKFSVSWLLHNRTIHWFIDSNVFMLQQHFVSSFCFDDRDPRNKTGALQVDPSEDRLVRSQDLIALNDLWAFWKISWALKLKSQEKLMKSEGAPFFNIVPSQQVSKWNHFLAITLISLVLWKTSTASMVLMHLQKTMSTKSSCWKGTVSFEELLLQKTEPDPTSRFFWVQSKSSNPQ